MLRRLLRGGRPLEQMGVSSECVPRYPELKGRGSICCRKSPPLTALDFWIFWAIPSTPTEQETCVSRPVVSASIPQKPLSLATYCPIKRLKAVLKSLASRPFVYTNPFRICAQRVFLVRGTAPKTPKSPLFVFRLPSHYFVVVVATK